LGLGDRDFQAYLVPYFVRTTRWCFRHAARDR
jgi:hypothetical protein